jgi:hypothetical protein
MTIADADGFMKRDGGTNALRLKIRNQGFA